ncbi:unnamed protein product (mitochondrion) [Plasmodiophora brassicae]|uniref:CW-type domain-containing protein n=1 Tax=Plasmodiophora brassicae TaxID=37360 RepID=A0A3P3Y5G7_PLABS|nr:unnamed protein product [Plasmodiophora brassicae]
MVDQAFDLSCLCKAAESDKDTENVTDAVYRARHRPLELEEREEKRLMVPEAYERWAVCDAPECRKWRRIPSDVQIQQQDKFYCGGHDTPHPECCDIPDDWLVECLGKTLTHRCESIGVSTVEALLDHPRLIKRLNDIGIIYEPKTMALRTYNA